MNAIFEKMESITEPFIGTSESIKYVVDSMRQVVEQNWKLLSQSEKLELLTSAGWACILYYITQDEAIKSEMVRLNNAEKEEDICFYPFCFDCSKEEGEFEGYVFTGSNIHKDGQCWNIGCDDSDCFCFDECTCDIADLTDFDMMETTEKPIVK